MGCSASKDVVEAAHHQPSSASHSRSGRTSSSPPAEMKPAGQEPDVPTTTPHPPDAPCSQAKTDDSTTFSVDRHHEQHLLCKPQNLCSKSHDDSQWLIAASSSAVSRHTSGVTSVVEQEVADSDPCDGPTLVSTCVSKFHQTDRGLRIALPTVDDQNAGWSPMPYRPRPQRWPSPDDDSADSSAISWVAQPASRTADQGDEAVDEEAANFRDLQAARRSTSPGRVAPEPHPRDIQRRVAARRQIALIRDPHICDRAPECPVHPPLAKIDASKEQVKEWLQSLPSPDRTELVPVPPLLPPDAAGVGHSLASSIALSASSPGTAVVGMASPCCLPGAVPAAER